MRRSLSLNPSSTDTMSGLANPSKQSESSRTFRMRNCWRPSSARHSGIFGIMHIRTAAWRGKGAIRLKRIFYWDYINEADDKPNLSKGTFGPEGCAVGGTGFGIMATIVAVQRNWIGREAAVDRLIQIVDFLSKADSYHGIYPHFLDGDTGKVIAFSRVDDGADVVETSYLMMGLLSARAYFNGDSVKERYLVKRINEMWRAANWNWHTQNDSKRFLWHWSPRNGFDMNFPVKGWNEALITYIISASSPRRQHVISREVYENTWVNTRSWRNGKSY